jgi:UPF0716 protein FxsA
VNREFVQGNNMFRILLSLFILVPIIEIAVFIELGGQIGLNWTLFIIVITAVLGVNLLKQQGLRTWQNIQLQTAQGQIPAIEMAAAAQLLFAGGLLLTPGFVTDSVGFLLMIPKIREKIAEKMIARATIRSSTTGFEAFGGGVNRNNRENQPKNQSGRTIEGEYEENNR